MKTSQAGIDLIKKWEGFEPEAYKDAVGKWTIGYGHLIRDGETFSRITLADAEELLRQDVEQAERLINRTVRYDIEQYEFDALVSLAYNIPSAFLAGTNLRAKIDIKGSYKRAASEFGRWIYGRVNGKLTPLPGLIKRRAEEALLFIGA